MEPFPSKRTSMPANSATASNLAQVTNSWSRKTQRVLDFLAASTKVKIKPRAVNVVLIRKDDSCSMGEVSVNGKCIMLGNDWDFHPGCHGFDLPDFSTAEELAALFANALTQAGNKVECVTDRTWCFED